VTDMSPIVADNGRAGEKIHHISSNKQYLPRKFKITSNL